MPTVEANGVDLYYERRGDGPPVVFLHGAGGDHRVWAEVADPLTDDYEVVVLDMRLHGRSGGEPSPPPSFEAYLDDLEAFVEALGLDTPALVGLSMGGMVAQGYAARHPDDVAALVTSGARTTNIQSREEWVFEHVVFPVADRLRTHLGPSYEHRFLKAVMEFRRGDDEGSDMEERERIETEHAADYPEQTDAQERAVRDALGDYQNLTIEYTTVTTPWLYLHGENETVVLEAHAAFVADTAPNASSQAVPDASHHAHVDNPDFVIDTIRDFLDEYHATADVEANADVDGA